MARTGDEPAAEAPAAVTAVEASVGGLLGAAPDEPPARREASAAVDPADLRSRLRRARSGRARRGGAGR
ncbi:MAG: hypothetical protein H6705_18475 [Myxococcales bacterium]|nr:hypothetical protein [Myxococcales bacterium]